MRSIGSSFRDSVRASSVQARLCDRLGNGAKWARLAELAAMFALGTASPACQAEGAFAFWRSSAGWASGIASDRETKAEAKAEAIAACAERASGGCEIITTFTNKCFAFAVQRGGIGYGWAHGASIEEAQQRSMNECAKRNSRCEVRHSRCDTVKEIERTRICVRPTLVMELSLRNKIDGTPEKTDEVAAALNFLWSEFCRLTEDALTAAEENNLGGGCVELSGTYRGEKVYWGRCDE